MNENVGIDLSGLKSWARRCLAPSHPVRSTIESQPNKLTLPEFLVMLIILDRMLEDAQ